MKYLYPPSEGAGGDSIFNVGANQRVRPKSKNTNKDDRIFIVFLKKNCRFAFE